MNAKLSARVHARGFERTILVVIVLVDLFEQQLDALKEQAVRLERRLAHPPERTEEPDPLATSE